MPEKLNRKNPVVSPGSYQRGNLQATAWDHTALLSILRFKEPVLPLLRLVSRVSCRSAAEGLEKIVLGRLIETVLQNE